MAMMRRVVKTFRQSLPWILWFLDLFDRDISSTASPDKLDEGLAYF